MHKIESQQDKFIIIGIESDSYKMSIEDSLNELKELVETTGATVCGSLTQKREKPHPGHYLGKGKVDELKDTISLFNATGIVCDDELTSTQIRNLADTLDVKILDRTLIILDIFANRASSAEGKVQVELAQQKYRLSHLTGIGKNLSRLGGGIGTRGPGEKKLETDRRHIKSRIEELESQLKDIATHRKVLREKREKNAEIIISIVGYTNAGKSTLLNTLTNADAYVANQLFATLDTTTRSLNLGNSSKVIITDTVGFINKLPHNLVKAFRSTLEELQYSDIVLHVVDSSNPSRAEHMDVVYKTLDTLSCTDKPIITIYNKIDLEVSLPFPSDKNAVSEVRMSATSGLGKDKLFTAIEDLLKTLRQRVSVLIPYEDGALMNKLRLKSEVLKEEYQEKGVFIEAYVNEEILNRVNAFIVNKL